MRNGVRSAGTSSRERVRSTTVRKTRSIPRAIGIQRGGSAAGHRSVQPMAAARRTPAGSRAGAGPAPRGPRRRFASSSRGPVSGSSRPLSAPAPGGRRRAHQRACNSHARRQFPRRSPGSPRPGPKSSPAPRSPRLRPGLRPDVSAWSRRGSYIQRPLRWTPRPSPEPKGLTMNGPESRRAERQRRRASGGT